VANPQIDRLRKNIGTVFLGDTRSVDLLLTAMFARGHVLIEDVPGVGKTVLARALSRSIDCKFTRIQLTPDLLPSDVLGVSVFNSIAQTFDFKPGPIFANIVLADEINRTTPRTQSAEHKILTTQPGRLALDQLKPVMTADEVVAIQDSATQIRMDTSIVDYVLDLADATRRHEQLHLGVSPRGALALTQACQAAALVSGREYVTPDDVKTLFIPCCAHRVVSKTYLHNGDVAATSRVLQTVLDRIPAPR